MILSELINMIFKSHSQREKCIDQACGEEKLLSLLSADTSIDLRNNFNWINQIYIITLRKKIPYNNSYTNIDVVWKVRVILFFLQI